MRIDVLSIFPAYLAPLELSLIGRARAQGLLDVAVHDLRGWAEDRHHSVDDAAYGGGPGMVMRPDVWWRAVQEVRGGEPARLVVPTPSGRVFQQADADVLAGESRLIVACGRYEGIDQRVLDRCAETMPVDEVSLGDFVLAGGEAAALVIVEAVTRLLPGVLGNERSAVDDSYGPGTGGLLEGPVYTRPEVWEGRTVPDVLRSGDHARIARWRRAQSLRRTAARRPDLLAAPAAGLSASDRAMLAEVGELPGDTDGGLSSEPDDVGQ